MAYVDEKVALEGDGFGVHRLKDAFESDRTRQNELVLAGWLVLRFTWQMICKRPWQVADAVRRALALRAR
jgi:very-short-patch-repair endonuclease